MYPSLFPRTRANEPEGRSFQERPSRVFRPNGAGSRVRGDDEFSAFHLTQLCKATSLGRKIYALFRSDKQLVRQINSKATRARAVCSTLGTLLVLETRFRSTRGGIQAWHVSSAASPPRTRRPSASLTTATSATTPYGRPSSKPSRR